MNFISYAQNFEDVMLHRALQDVKKGFYIDVGANDPIIDSVTKAFYNAGWHGINIEPVSQWYEKLQQDRPDDINLQVAVGARKGNINFYEIVDTGLSTTDESIAKRHVQEHGYELNSYKVPAVRLTTICEQYPQEEIHFLKIDVEGAEHSVLKGLNLKKIRPWIVLVESTLPNTQIEDYREWEPLLIESGYHYVYFDGLSRYYVADEHKNLDKSFMNPPNIFDGFKRANEAFLERQVEHLTSEWHGVKNQINKEKEAVAQIEESLHDSEQQRQQLEKQLQALRTEQQKSEETLQAKETKLQEAAVLLTDSQQQVDTLQASLLDSQKQQQVLNAALQEEQKQHQQVEAQLQTLQTVFHQREEKLQEKETRLQELLLSLVEKETKLQEAAVLLTDSQQQVDTLQASLLDSQNQQQALNVTLQETQKQRQQLEIQLQPLQAEVHQRDEKLQEKEASIIWLNNEWDATKHQLDEVHQSNHYWWSEAERLNIELQSVYNSKSWHVTWPLRKLMQFSKRLIGLPVSLGKLVFRQVKKPVKSALLILMKFVLDRPWIKKRVKHVLSYCPNVRGQLKALATNNNLLNNHFIDSTYVEPLPKVGPSENNNEASLSGFEEVQASPENGSEGLDLDKLFSLDAISRVATLIHERRGK